MQKTAFLENINRLMQMYAEGRLGGETMPEDALTGIVSRDDCLGVLTLGMSLNYQRSAYALWQAVARTYQDEDTRWVFHPLTAAECDLDALRQGLHKHRVALQPNRHPEIWQKVAAGIAHSSEKRDVSGLLESAHFDIAELKSMMQTKRKAEFPYLSGPKIFNYWLYVLETYAGVKWKSRELITIAADTHILQGTVRLGLCSANILKGSAEDRRITADAWEKALAGSGLAPIDVHTPLWLWSRAGFPRLVTDSSEMQEEFV
ncbi:hypothetical protein [Gorillibacterium massiliense]|uniref:hypothetical protein n=1 Tax=Gorillibacterium massiliense TaxID=1280390 RepID=UPI000694F107|nr:hypothetical protein [Gorillibacterium massiliense]